MGCFPHTKRADLVGPLHGPQELSDRPFCMTEGSCVAYKLLRDLSPSIGGVYFSGASGSRSITYFPRATLIMGTPGIFL